MFYKISLFIITTIAFIIVFCWNKFMPTQYQNNHAYFIVLLLAVFSFVTNFFLSQSMKAENKNAFTLRFMAMSGIKLFLSLFVILIYAFLNKKQIVSFAVLYLFFYFLFTGTETYFLYKETRK